VCVCACVRVCVCACVRVCVCVCVCVCAFSISWRVAPHLPTLDFAAVAQQQHMSSLQPPGKLSAASAAPAAAVWFLACWLIACCAASLCVIG
jgi:hypothetical protein